MTALLVICGIFFCSEYGHSQEQILLQSQKLDLEAWETEDLIIESNNCNKIINPQSLMEVLSLTLIQIYQKDISPQSISRCPFYPSCSNFATNAISKYGFLIGTCLFIDRNLYRENPNIYQHYTFVETSPGLLKLDDSYFLNLSK